MIASLGRFKFEFIGFKCGSGGFGYQRGRYFGPTLCVKSICGNLYLPNR